MNSQIDEIKSKIDIVDLVSEYVKLQRAGNSFKALCPFHNERTPSFFVSQDKQIFHCFGCGEGGDIFKFLMKIEGIEFYDALKILAEKAGVNLKIENKEERTKKEVLQQIITDAARFFYKNLFSKKGESALAYLSKRGVNKDLIDEFKLGYAPNSYSDLYEFLRLKGYSSADIELSGLIFCKSSFNKKRCFDRFRDRIMFPILNPYGYIVGFTGRYLKEKPNEGKYINSPATPIFDKSKILFNLDKAKTEIKRLGYAVLVEGQMDVILLFSDGIKNVIATSGTAFTYDHAKLLKRYASTIKIAFDSDDAGQNATQRAIEVLQQLDFSVEIILLPKKDPADIVLETPGKFKEIMENSIPVMEYYFELAKEKFDINNIQGKKLAAEFLLSKIKLIKNQIETYEWLNKLSLMLRVDLKYLESELKKIILKDYNNQKFIQKSKEIKESNDINSISKIFESLISILYKKPELSSYLKEIGFLDFMNEFKKDIKKFLDEELIEMFDFFIKYDKLNQISEFENKYKDSVSLSRIIVMSELMHEKKINLEHELVFQANQIKDQIFKRMLQEKNIEIKLAEQNNNTNLPEKIKELNNIIQLKKIWQFPKNQKKQ